MLIFKFVCCRCHLVVYHLLQTSGNRDWTSTKAPRGKGKSGAFKLQADTKLCRVTATKSSQSDESEVAIKSSKIEMTIRAGIDVCLLIFLYNNPSQFQCRLLE